MFKLINRGIIIAFFATGVCFVLGLLLGKYWEKDFWSNFFLNITAELFGVALTLLILAFTAKQKFEKLAPKIIDFIAKLKKDEKIDGQTARSAVVCAVEILSEESFLKTKPQLSIITHDKNCRVCTLEAGITPELNNTVRCSHCKLPSKIWDKN